MATEIKDGRGAGPHGDYLLLKLDHLGPEVIEKRLPGIREIAKKFADVDPVKDPIPVVPTVHYMMGGIPTNYHGEVVVPEFSNGRGNPEAVVPGFYAAGECACASVHGANRLGTNSLTDLLVFGKAAAESIIEFLRENPGRKDLPKDAAERTQARLARLDGQKNGESVAEVGMEIRRTMQAHCGVFRFPEMLVKGVKKIHEIADRATRTQIKDKSRVFNTARVEALELDNLIEVARASMVSAEARRESRGALVQRGRPARVQAGAHEAADGSDHRAEGTDLLTQLGEACASGSSATTLTRTKSRPCRTTRSGSTRTTACSSMLWCASRSRTTV
jgi:succinate dehydrogenase / fumarate reductase flavoprotein subunit